MVAGLASALERAAAALEAEDAASASAALEEALRACATTDARGVKLDRAQLEILRALHRKGEAAAERAAEELERALGSAGSARRALSAYRG
jgi:hypothetical protein